VVREWDWRGGGRREKTGKDRASDAEHGGAGGDEKRGRSPPAVCAKVVKTGGLVLWSNNSCERISNRLTHFGGQIVHGPPLTNPKMIVHPFASEWL
jgi:hypothetical protein